MPVCKLLSFWPNDKMPWHTEPAPAFFMFSEQKQDAACLYPSEGRNKGSIEDGTQDTPAGR